MATATLLANYVGAGRGVVAALFMLIMTRWPPNPAPAYGGMPQRPGSPPAAAGSSPNLFDVHRLLDGAAEDPRCSTHRRLEETVL